MHRLLASLKVGPIAGGDKRARIYLSTQLLIPFVPLFTLQASHSPALTRAHVLRQVTACSAHQIIREEVLVAYDSQDQAKVFVHVALRIKALRNARSKNDHPSHQSDREDNRKLVGRRNQKGNSPTGNHKVDKDKSDKI